MKDDFDVAIVAVGKNPYNFKRLSERLRNDREVVMSVVSRDGNCLEYANERFLNDKEIVLAALSSKYHYSVIGMIGEDLRNDADFFLEAAKKNILKVFNECSPTLSENEEFLKRALKVNGNVLYYLPQKYKGMRSFVKLAIQNNGLSLLYVRERFGGDREIVLEAVKNQGTSLSSVHKSLKKDREIVMLAVKNDGMALRYASYSENFSTHAYAGFRNDKEIVLEAVKNNGAAIQFASSDLKKDIDVICQAVETSGKEIVCSKLSRSSYYYYYNKNEPSFDNFYHKNERIIMACLRHNFLKEKVRKMVENDESERVQFMCFDDQLGVISMRLRGNEGSGLIVYVGGDIREYFKSIIAPKFLFF